MNKKTKIFIILGILVLIPIITYYFKYQKYLKILAQTIGIEKQELLRQIRVGFQNPYDKKHLNILILGLDKRNDDNSLLTDTILLTTINTESGDYTLFSVPRDLWLPDLQTKINALYYYGQVDLVSEQIQEIFGWKPNYTVILEMSDIKKLVDRIGGVEVEIEKGFVDENFPKDDGSNEVMTIKFEAGKQVLDGEKALQYIRSRKSEDPENGTDMSRQQRQKQVILGLKNSILTNKAIFQPKNLGNLYNFFDKEIETYPKINLEILSSFWQVGMNLVQGEQKEVSIPWKAEDENQILVSGHDPIYNTWILQPKNNDWKKLKDFFQNNLP